MAIIFASASEAAAARPKKLGKFQYWEAYTEGEGREKICYIVSQPQRKLPRGATRGEILLAITHRPAAAIRYETALRLGYPMTSKVTPMAEIDGKRFRFFSGAHAKSGAEEWAWLELIEETDPLINHMKTGTLMVFTAQSTRGTQTTDSYSLMGFTRALATIDKACP